ncbi:MAG: VTT domain-containing protein [Candidatus Bathyarchaeia archaeon]
MTALYELLGILATSFILNIIPFTGPSNMLIAANMALLVNADPFTTGFLVASGSALAKSIHYAVTFFVSGFVDEERRKRLDAAGTKIKNWAFLALFIVAASPLPDEPIIIPLGILKYNPVKFFVPYFIGKLLISVIGAYLGNTVQEQLAPFVSQEVLVIASIIFTVVVTILLLKVDISQFIRKVKQKKRNSPMNNALGKAFMTAYKIQKVLCPKKLKSCQKHAQ